MAPEEMITQSLSVQVFDSPNSAPHYGSDTKLLRAENALIVLNGTIHGNPTVDLQLVDAEGNKYLVMATGGIINMLSSAIVGVSQREKQNTTKEH